MNSVTPLQSNTMPPVLYQNRMRFSGASNLVGWVATVDKLLAPVQASRFKQMMFEDVFGFAVPRTSLDLSREYIFKETQNNERKLNWAAARERAMMEVMGFFQWWPAVAATGVAALAKGKTAGTAPLHLSQESLELFGHILKQQAPTDASSFITHLGQAVFPQAKNTATLQVLQQLNKPSTNAAELATNLAKELGLKHFDATHAGGTQPLQQLFQDTQHILRLSNNNTVPFAQSAKQLIRKAAGFKKGLIPAMMATGLLYNFFSPLVIQKTTQKVDNLADYPALAGLRHLTTVQEKHQRQQQQLEPGLFSYVRQQLRQLNPIPLLVGLTPLPIALGMVDVQKLAQSLKFTPKGIVNGFKTAWQSPALNKAFLSRYVKQFQLQRGFPFATSHHIAALYSALLMSRMLSSRNGIEFRERVVDAGLGWSIWMLATPMVSKYLAQRSDKLNGTQLLKTVNGISLPKSAAELKNLLPKQLLQKNMTQNAKFGYLALLGTIGLLGLVEPLISIKLSEWQAKREQRKAVQPTSGITKPVNTLLTR